MNSHLERAKGDISGVDVPSTKSATAHALIAIAEQLEHLNDLLTGIIHENYAALRITGTVDTRRD